MRNLLNMLLFLFITFNCYAQEIVVKGKSYSPEQLEKTDFEQLIPLTIDSGRQLLADWNIRNCRQWNQLSHKEQDEKMVSANDKFGDIMLTDIRDICWLENIIKNANPIKSTVSIEALADMDHYPAGLLYTFNEDSYVDNGKIVDNSKPKPVSSKKHKSRPSSCPIDEIKLMFNSTTPLSMEGLLSKYDEECPGYFDDFEPGGGTYDPYSFEFKNPITIVSNYSYMWFYTTVVAKGFDMDGDGIEDWAVMVEVSGTGANWGSCYPAILSRIGDVFYIKQSLPARRCA